MTFRVFHIVLWASHLLITGDACHNKVTPNGRSGIAAIHGVASSRTHSYNGTPLVSLHTFELKQILNLYTTHYKLPFAFYQFLYPLSHHFPLRGHYPGTPGANRLTSFHIMGKDIKPHYSDPVAGDIKHSVADVQKARSFGYKPDTIKWFENKK